MNPKPSAPAAELRSEVWRLRPILQRAVILSFLAGALSLSPSLYMLEVYTRVVDSRSLMTLLMLTLAVTGAYIVMEVLEWVRAQILRHAGQQLDARLGERVFGAVFLLNLHRGQGAGQQAMADLRTVREFFGAPAALAAMDSPVVIFIMIILFWMHPMLGWFAVLGGIVQTIIAFLTNRRTQLPLTAANKAAMAAQNYAGNSLRNAQVIESMGMLEGIHQRWMRHQREFLQQQASASDHAGGLASAAKSVQLISASGMLGLAAWLILTGDLLDAGLMIVAMILGGKVLQPIVQLVSNWKSVVEVRGAYARLDELLRQIPAGQERMSLPPPKGLLSVEAVTAGAPGSPLPILRNVSFTLPAGECLAVVGPSASGKTTLARLLMGLWPAMSGKVRLDGADVYAWNKSELGPHVGYLPQGVELFDGTLAENIARFGEVDIAQVEEAARLVGLDALVAELPDGYHSRIGDEGAFLSGGQRQRVGLARAIYGQPRFIVLDEPNSSLDELGEKALAGLVSFLKSRGVTIVIITHRTSILAVADRMLLLVNGAVQAYGPRDEVLVALAKAREGQAVQTPANASGMQRPALGTTPAA
ncbi:MAG: type I secretion system permease/ATPase [Rhodocyclaceae bacterium]